MSVQTQVLDFIRRPDPTRFESLALAVFADQFANVGAFRQFCLSRGVSPARIASPGDIPPVSTAAFKYVEFYSGTPERVFVTSGTTRGRQQRGRHLVTNLELYRASALGHLERMMFPDRQRPWMLALHPTADRMPESSLSQMISWCIESLCGARSLCCASPQQVDCAAALDFLRAAEASAEPVCILATTAAASALFEYLSDRGARLRLAAGSRLMDTGGPKGQSKPLTPEEVRALAFQYLALAPAYVINEYGMTELSSQLYDATALNCPGAAEGGERDKIAPPWMRVIARDPATLRALPPGEIGLLSFIDLANAGSVSALLTEDLGVVNTDGTVRVLGRVIGLDPRGCALSIEQFARGEHPRPDPHPNLLPGQGEERQVSVGAWAPAARTARLVHETASALRVQARGKLAPQRIAAALADACKRWRDPAFSARAATLDTVAASTGQSRTLLDASLDALLAGFTADAILELAGRLGARDRLIGFIMPGNVIGAGLHELVQALIGGAAVMVKASSLEPLFFAQFQRTLDAIDARVAARMDVAVWDRSDRESTIAMAEACDRVVAFGDDDSIAAIGAIAGAKLVDFGSRTSGALLSRESIAGAHAQGLAAALARDVSLFDQRGCLSLHHIFVEAPDIRDAREFAAALADAMAALARPMPPAASRPIAELSAARAAREDARWRRIGGAPLELFEGENLAWTVIFDSQADFQISPLCRTVYVSTLRDQSDLCGRLHLATGALEGFAIADPANRLSDSSAALRQMGVSYLCAPGSLQSPPPSWEHGRGRFLRLVELADG
jgi:Acyl-CoA reductase (LuxC)/Acyl-protein synthetase, LuxE